MSKNMTTGLSMPPAFYEEVDKLAAHEGITRAMMLRRIAARGLTDITGTPNDFHKVPVVRKNNSAAAE